MTYTAIQTVEVGGIPCTEYRYEPDRATLVQLGGIQYITATEKPGQPTNRYLVTLINRLTGQEQVVDLVISKSGFSTIAHHLRQHFSFDWEICHWQDMDTPF